MTIRRSLKSRTLLPTDFGDFLAIISAFGFLAIFFEYGLNIDTLMLMSTPVFLILGGFGLMIVGNVLTIKQWTKDGIQPNEYSQLFAVVFGISSVLLGSLILMGVTLPLTIRGWVGLFAFPPLIYIMIHYYLKNKYGVC